jgi:hypothetical protein
MEVAVALEKSTLSLNLVADVLGGLLAKLEESLLSLVAGGGADLSLILELGDNGAVLPSDVLSELAQDGNTTVGRQLESAESLRDNNTLNLVKRRRNTLENLEVGQSGGTTSGLVRKHSTDGAPEHLRWGAEVERTTTGVGVHVLLQERQELHYRLA